MGPYDSVEPDDVEDPNFDPSEYWNDVLTSDDEDDDEEDW